MQIIHDLNRQVLICDDLDGTAFELPAKFEVCDTCGGKGSHVNRAIDGHGLSQEDFDEDPDFADAYFAGRYDVRCETCNGQRVELVVDEATANPEHLQAYYDWLQSEAQYAAEVAAERRMGA